MSFKSWLSRAFLGIEPNEKGEKLIDITSFGSQSAVKFRIEEFAVCVAAETIANLVSKCEFITFLNGKAVKNSEYYTWNFEPNKNQSGPVLLRNFIGQALTCSEGALLIDVGGNLLLADSFNRKPFALKGDVFSNVKVDTLTFQKDFYASDVIFLKWQSQELDEFLHGLKTLYSEALSEAHEKYIKSNGTKGVMNISATARGNPNYEKDLETLLNERFKTYFSSKNAVLPLPNGFDFTEKTQNAPQGLVGDIESLTRQALERAANAMHIAPALLRGEVTGAKDALDLTLTLGVQPIVNALQSEINRKRYGMGVLQGSYIKIDLTRAKYTDIFSVAIQADKLIAAGVFSTNDIRRRVGEEEINAPWANEYQRTKNYENAAKGGEANGI